MMPITSIARESRGVETKHRANLSGAQGGNQTIKAGSLDGATCGATEIVVDHFDIGEAASTCDFNQLVLAPLALQVQSNLESQRRQYELVDMARRRGFTDIEVIDDDLGRTASGAVERPGFDRLVAALCAGQVGAVLCLDASRLARNGRDWHHLLELCGIVEARVIDLDGVYDPCRPNDRLLLGMKGSISEFELGIIRSRMYEAARSKARRGELRLPSPIGYTWDRHVGLGLDPDRRLQEVIRLVFQKFRELGSARQVLLWMASQNVHFPYPSNGRTLTSFEWRPIRYRNVISILKNPFYAGVYAYGKSEKRTTIVDGRARKSYGHHKPMG